MYVYWGCPHSVWAAMLLSGIGGRCLTHDYERKVSNTLSPEAVLHWKEVQRKERKKDSIRGNVQLTWPKLKCFWLTEGNKRCTLFSSEVTIHGQGQGQIQGDHVPAARLKNKTQRRLLTEQAERWTWAQQSAAGSVSHLEGRKCFPKLCQWPVKAVCIDLDVNVTGLCLDCPSRVFRITTLKLRLSVWKSPNTLRG